MKKMLLALAFAFAMTTSATAAEQVRSDSKQTKPTKLTKSELAKVIAGKITEVHKNNGGNTPNGNAFGVPTENQNPTGKPPPGQNK